MHATAIVNYRVIANKMAEAVRRSGGEIELGAMADGIRESSDEVAITARNVNGGVNN